MGSAAWHCDPRERERERGGQGRTAITDYVHGFLQVRFNAGVFGCPVQLATTKWLLDCQGHASRTMSSVLLHRVSVSTFTRLSTRGFVVAAAPSLRRDGIKANLDDRGTRYLLSFAVGAGSVGHGVHGGGRCGRGVGGGGAGSVLVNGEPCTLAGLGWAGPLSLRPRVLVKRIP